MKFLRKWGACSLAFAFTLSLALTGCTQNSNNAANQTASSTAAVSAGQSAAASGKYTKPGEFPISNEKITLKVFTMGDGIKPVKDAWFTQWYEEKTNIHLEWEETASDGYVEKRNVKIAGGDLPDIFANAWFGFTPTEQAQYGSQGVLVDLMPLINDYSVEFKKLLAERPEIEKFFKINGKMYSLPEINECYHCTYYQKMWYNKTLLDKLGLKAPTTTQEFEDTLKQIKQKDPSLIPLAGSNATDSYTTPVSYLISPFQYNSEDADKPTLANVPGGKVTAIVNTDGFKEGLKYAQKLWKQGLLYKETFTMDPNTLIKLNNENGNDGKIVFVSGSHKGFYAGWDAKDKVWQNYHILEPLAGPDGSRSTAILPYGFGNGMVSITSACKEPQAAYRLVDWLYSEEGTRAADIGREGVEWAKPDAGGVGINGKPANFKTLSPEEVKEPPFSGGAATWGQRFVTNRDENYRLSQQLNADCIDPFTYKGEDSNKPLEKLLYDATAQIAKYAPPREEVLPQLVYPDSVLADQIKITSELQQYVKETRVRFITTKDLDIDKEWSNYLTKLKDIGLDTYLQNAQAAYDTQFK